MEGVRGEEEEWELSDARWEQDPLVIRTPWETPWRALPTTNLSGSHIPLGLPQVLLPPAPE